MSRAAFVLRSRSHRARGSRWSPTCITWIAIPSRAYIRTLAGVAIALGSARLVAADPKRDARTTRSSYLANVLIERQHEIHAYDLGPRGMFVVGLKRWAR